MSLLPSERRTLEIGSAIVLSGLGLGLQVGHWPLWSAGAAYAGYLAWIVLYSEATVQARRMHTTSTFLRASQAAAPPA